MVDVVEKEKPDGKRWSMLAITFLRTTLKPEFKSGIFLPVRKLATLLRIHLPGLRIQS